MCPPPLPPMFFIFLLNRCDSAAYIYYSDNQSLNGGVHNVCSPTRRPPNNYQSLLQLLLTIHSVTLSPSYLIHTLHFAPCVMGEAKTELAFLVAGILQALASSLSLTFLTRGGTINRARGANSRGTQKSAVRCGTAVI